MYFFISDCYASARIPIPTLLAVFAGVMRNSGMSSRCDLAA